MPPRNTVGIIVRLLTKTYCPLTSAFTLVVKCSCVIDTAIVPERFTSESDVSLLLIVEDLPDRHIVGILPSQSHLKVVVFSQQFQEPLSQMGTLVFSHLVDAFSMVANSEDTLPARNLDSNQHARL